MALTILATLINQYWKVSGIVHYLKNKVFRRKDQMTVIFTGRILQSCLRFSHHFENVSCFSWVYICGRQQSWTIFVYGSTNGKYCFCVLAIIFQSFKSREIKCWKLSIFAILDSIGLAMKWFKRPCYCRKTFYNRLKRLVKHLFSHVTCSLNTSQLKGNINTKT